MIQSNVSRKDEKMQLPACIDETKFSGQISLSFQQTSCNKFSDRLKYVLFFKKYVNISQPRDTQAFITRCI